MQGIAVVGGRAISVVSDTFTSIQNTGETVLSHLGCRGEGWDAYLCFPVLFGSFLETRFHCVALAGLELLRRPG